MASKPFDIPEEIKIKTPLDENMYNTLTAEDRMIYYKMFWKNLPSVLPFVEWRKLWKKYDKEEWATRVDSLKNLYSIRCSLETDLELQNKTKFSNLCKELRSYKSGCNKSKKSKTCRKKRNS